MACALDSGYALDCKDGAGGIKEVYFIAFDDVTEITETAGVVTTLTKAVGKQFYKIALPKETASYEESLMGSDENGTIAYDQSLSLIINKKQTATRNMLMILAKNRLLEVHKDNNGKYWLMGKENACHISTGKFGTGTKLVDRNGYEFTVKGMEKEPAVEVNSAIGDVLETPGA